MTPTADDLRRLFAPVARGTVPLVVLTDEEVSALLEVWPEPRPPLRWLDGRDDIGQQAAADVGARSLLVRGLVRGVGADRESDLSLRVAVEAPRLAHAIVEATLSDGSFVRLASIPGLGVVESVSGPTGFHLFTACSVGDAAARAGQGWLPDVASVDAGQPERRITLSEWPRLVEAELGRHVSTVAVDAWTQEHPRGLTWSIAHDGSTALSCSPVDDTTGLVRLVDRRSHAQLITHLLDGVTATTP